MGVNPGVYFSDVGVFCSPPLRVSRWRALALTDTEIRKSKPANKPYKLSDSGGMYLLVTPAGGKLWRLKYRVEGTEKLMALGRYATGTKTGLSPTLA